MTKIDVDNFKLVGPRDAAEMLGTKPEQLSWRRVRGELALPYVKIGYRSVRYRMGDLLLVASGQRPLIKHPSEAAWVSPYSASGVQGGE